MWRRRLQFDKDIGSRSCQPAAMVRRMSELEVVEADRFWVRVTVARDACFPECFQCEVAVFPREVDSEWSDLDLNKPVEKPQTLGEFSTSDAALEHGLALGKFLSSMY